MSDRENSPDVVGNSSERQSLEEKTPSAEGSPSHPAEERRSHSRGRSRSRSHSFRRRRSYSRSSKTIENPDEVETDGPRSHSSRGHRYRHYSRSRSHSPRHRRYSRSRSRSRSYSPRHSYSPQYSPRRSYYDDYYRYGGGSSSGGGGGGGGGGSSKGRYSSRYNRSPMSSRRRHVGNRDNPEPSRCLGVFGLSLYTQERELREVFGKYGPIEDVQVVYDAQEKETNKRILTEFFTLIAKRRSRGFAFVYFEDTDDAKMAKERCNGQEIDGRKIRVDFSITKRAHTPTPGIYMGKPTYPKFGGHRDGGYRNHSPSPYYGKHRYSRSRSRSYSPRFWERRNL
ncbi:hypothetical protein CEXT_324031 [Caerostris extrusa]|uniref:RRM domain-containing protein n=1 Tax=Caerostris extrusa TaxID=172846 RepID=A0AAV4R256_CAEEX|nr:hypothetical protein CEXT_324031 [Caerostris extrusa]